MGRKTLLAIASVTILATAAFAREPVGTNAPSPRSTDDPMVSDHAVNTKGTGANNIRAASGQPNTQAPTPRGTFPAIDTCSSTASTTACDHAADESAKKNKVEHWGDPHENVNGRVPAPRGRFLAVP